MTEFDSRDRDQELHELFARIESRPLSSTIFLYHAAISVFVVPISGLLTFWLTPFTGAILGIVATKRWRSRIVIFSFLPTTLLFLWALTGVLVSWNPSWAHMGRWEYAKNSFLGPNCSSSECLGTAVTAQLTGGLGYAFGGC